MIDYDKTIYSSNVEWVEMRSSSFAIVSQVAVGVNVESVQTGSQAQDGAANDNRSTCRRLFKAQLASDVGKFRRAVDIGNGRHWPLL